MAEMIAGDSRGPQGLTANSALTRPRPVLRPAPDEPAITAARAGPPRPCRPVPVAPLLPPARRGCLLRTIDRFDRSRDGPGQPKTDPTALI
ncbi:hypothetical protein UA75_19895 [Actinoalloteichus sp. GBA129-24]|uniref:Uncharacterized protein n=1 Tax=Actinoalloteichus fjordicus TaxID=1612552 RepID=A0AAC9PTI1_9PSEU|nr:hypothetical protein UA74_19405 [Actinoalloteichus fjordicus]APU21968.1 hypothetical protein UA75_19895 [Actinoalloteichus sp. GBA129-24]